MINSDWKYINMTSFNSCDSFSLCNSYFYSILHNRSILSYLTSNLLVKNSITNLHEIYDSFISEFRIQIPIHDFIIINQLNFQIYMKTSLSGETSVNDSILNMTIIVGNNLGEVTSSRNNREWLYLRYDNYCRKQAWRGNKQSKQLWMTLS